MDEAGREEVNNSRVTKDFYTVAEAARLLEVGQRRILQMLEAKEIEGRQDPNSGRWKIPKHVVDELAPEEPPVTEEPLVSKQALTENLTEGLPEWPPETVGELIGELERLKERLQLAQQTQDAAWQEERESLLAELESGRQRAEELKEEVDRLSTELETERSKRSWRGLLRG